LVQLSNETMHWESNFSPKQSIMISKGGGLGGNKKFGAEMEFLAASSVLQLWLRTNHADALAFDAWATLAAEKGES
jgi:hypothetical protein